MKIPLTFNDFVLTSQVGIALWLRKLKQGLCINLEEFCFTSDDFY